MMHSGVTVCLWNSPALSAGNTGFYVYRSVFAKQSETRSTTAFGNWCRNVCIVQDTRPRHQWLYKAHTVTHGQAYHKTLKLLVIGECSCMHVSRQKDITLNTCLTKTGTFHSQHTTQPALFRATKAYWRKHVCFVSFLAQLFKSK